MKPSEILEKAADLLEPEGSWTKNHYALTKDNAEVSWNDPEAICFCVEGAISRIAGGRTNGLVARRFLQDVIRKDIVCWNDAAARTQPEVVRALREAAHLAKEQEYSDAL